ncbi:MAG TPA: aldo/keto reductase [Nocardioidaceae bacterium]|nr:aldo/keto reductase [Nocardioidaceae bacterium]
MEERSLGATGLKVSRFALGTWSWGRDTDEYEARDQLTAFVDAGGTLLDTAVSYGNGASEELLGELLRDTVSPQEVQVSTKAGVGGSDKGRVRDTSRGAMLRALDTSLSRLGVDHVDLWQVHLWVDEVPMDEVMATLDLAVSSGRARYVGVSNFSGWQTARAATWQQAWPGRTPLASTQVEYSLLNRGVEREVLPAAAACGLGVLAWSPLGRGVLSGKYRTGTPADSRAASPHLERFVAPYLHAEAAQVVEAVSKAADGLGLSPVEVALAWLRDRPGVTAPILGARTAAQLRGALTAEQVVLPAEITAALDDVSAIDLGYPER